MLIGWLMDFISLVSSVLQYMPGLMPTQGKIKPTCDMALDLALNTLKQRFYLTLGSVYSTNLHGDLCSHCCCCATSVFWCRWVNKHFPNVNSLRLWNWNTTHGQRTLAATSGNATRSCSPVWNNLLVLSFHLEPMHWALVAAHVAQSDTSFEGKLFIHPVILTHIHIFHSNFWIGWRLLARLQEVKVTRLSCSMYIFH